MLLGYFIYLKYRDYNPYNNFTTIVIKKSTLKVEKQGFPQKKTKKPLHLSQKNIFFKNHKMIIFYLN